MTHLVRGSGMGRCRQYARGGTKPARTTRSAAAAAAAAATAAAAAAAAAAAKAAKSIRSARGQRSTSPVRVAGAGAEAGAGAGASGHGGDIDEVLGTSEGAASTSSARSTESELESNSQLDAAIRGGFLAGRSGSDAHIDRVAQNAASLTGGLPPPLAAYVHGSKYCHQQRVPPC